MNAYFHYMVDSGLTLGVLTLIYLFFFRKETYFRFNRIFLLGSVVFSGLMPFVTIPVFVDGENAGGTFSVVLNTVPVYAHTYTNDVSQILSDYGIAGVIYLSGVVLFLFFFFLRIVSLARLFHRSVLKRKMDTISLMESNEVRSPFSFFHFIVIPVGSAESSKMDSMLIHEKEHVKQYHSLDILILEVLTIFQWCNPFIWLVRRLVRENHEFLADRAVLNNGYNRNRYKLLLLSQVAGGGFLMTNNFSYSLIKIRIRMITKNRSTRYAIGRIGVGLIVAAGLLISLHLQAGNLKVFPTPAHSPILNKASSSSVVQSNFLFPVFSKSQLVVSGEKVNSPVVRKYKRIIRKSHAEKAFMTIEQMPQFAGGMKELSKFLSKKLKYPAEATEKGVEGTIVATFVISKTGVVQEPRIIRGIGGGCDEEALRVIRLMPKWKPGKQDGKDVDVLYTLPIKFSIQKDQ